MDSESKAQSWSVVVERPEVVGLHAVLSFGAGIEARCHEKRPQVMACATFRDVPEGFDCIDVRMWPEGGREADRDRYTSVLVIVPDGWIVWAAWCKWGALIVPFHLEGEGVPLWAADGGAK